MTSFGIHLCHPWSGDCALHGLRISIRTPWRFVLIGLSGGAVQRQRRDGTYADEWTWLVTRPPVRGPRA
jgi:hypothetical protein